MNKFNAIAAMLACLWAGHAQAARSTQFDITLQPAGESARSFKVHLPPKGSVRHVIRDDLTLEVHAPAEEHGQGRSELRLLSQQKDGSFKVLHIAGIATFPNEVVQAGYGICAGKVTYRSEIAPGAAVCQ
ncbi:hypothetical protein KY495_08580 [Massilia sp. PAMC28688]|uniref:hypothetical protein n=1 Tax=Massilia sp. PAMC28688 TaxID=2861283 RepID=UPI001C62BAF4|nr:hypothetical protein [Massilia sp. PAMC28688]QYF95193.1 hypothetical protein KY495_08580 [Massilia sp. PAMC28688]